MCACVWFVVIFYFRWESFLKLLFERRLNGIRSHVRNTTILFGFWWITFWWTESRTEGCMWALHPPGGGGAEEGAVSSRACLLDGLALQCCKQDLKTVSPPSSLRPLVGRWTTDCLRRLPPPGFLDDRKQEEMLPAVQHSLAFANWKAHMSTSRRKAFG